MRRSTQGVDFFFLVGIFQHTMNIKGRVILPSSLFFVVISHIE
jgi:hypothetical protein